MTDLDARIRADLDEPHYDVADIGMAAELRKDALRAVLDLHKKVLPPRGTAVCRGCGQGRWNDQPCQTLVEIARSLGVSDA